MKQKNFAFCLCMALLGLTQVSFSQKNILVGVQGGISIPDLTSGSSSNPLASGWSSRLGSDYGILATMKLKGKFSLQVELNYSSQGGKKDGEQAVPATEDYLTIPPPVGTPSLLYANLNNVTKINYLQLPIMAKYTLPLGNGFHLFIDAGPYVGLMLAAKTVANGYTEFYTDKAETMPLAITNGQAFNISVNEDIRSQIKHINAGLQGGVGLEKKFLIGYLTLTAGGNYGFIPVQRQSSNGKNNTGAATLKIGYIFKI